MDFLPLQSFFDLLLANPAITSALIASSVAVWGIRTQRSISRQKNSLDFESAYKRNAELAEHNSVIVSLIHDIRDGKLKNPDVYLKTLARQKFDEFEVPERELAQKRNKSITVILNEWERTANATFSALYDENYLYRAHGTAIIELFSVLKHYMQERQVSNPRLYINLTMLCVRWGTRRHCEDNQKVSNKLALHLKKIRESGVNFAGHQVQETMHGEIKDLQFLEKQIFAIIMKRRYILVFAWIRNKLPF